MNITSLKQIVDNIKYLENQKQEIADQIKFTYDEAKSNGFNTKIIKKLISIKDTDKYKQELAEMKVYCEAVQLNLFD